MLPRLVLLNAVGFAAVGVALVGYGAFAAGRMRQHVGAALTPIVEGSAAHRLNALALDTVAPLRAVFQQGDEAAATMAAATVHATERATAVGEGYVRPWLTRVVHDALAVATGAKGTYLVLERDALDGADASFVDASDAGSNETGRYAPYWERTEEGSLEYEPIEDDDLTDTTLQEGRPTNLWWECPRQTGARCLLEPYDDVVNDHAVLMASVVHPVVANGRVIGIAGADIGLAFLKGLVAEANAHAFEGSGRTLLVSASGTLAADSGDGALGKDARAVLGDDYDAVRAAIAKDTPSLVLSGAGDSVDAVVPFRLLAGAPPWAVYIRLPRVAVLGDAALVDAILTHERNVTVAGQMLVGGVLLVLALGAMAWALHRVITPAHDAAEAIRTIAAGVDAAAGTTADVAERNSERIAAQRLDLDAIGGAVTAMAGAVDGIAASADGAAEAASRASRSAAEGRDVVVAAAGRVRDVADDITRGSAVIDALKGRSDAIAEVLETIGEIAQHTNLLALNAAVEAAHAGEAGRGFAVVAAEVRTLADRTRAATARIHEMMALLVEGADAAVDAMARGGTRVRESVSLAEQAEQALLAITAAVDEIHARNASIAASVQEQSSAAADVRRSVTAVGQFAVDLADAVVEASHASADLAADAARLRGLVERLEL